MDDFNPIPFDITAINIRKALYTIFRDKNGSYALAQDEDPILEKAWGVAYEWIQQNMPIIVEYSDIKTEQSRVKYNQYGRPFFSKGLFPLIDLDKLVFSIILMAHAKQSGEIENIAYNRNKEILAEIICSIDAYIVNTTLKNLERPQLSWEQSSFLQICDSVSSLLQFSKKSTKLLKKPDDLSLYMKTHIEARKPFIDDLLPVLELIKPLKVLVVPNKSYSHRPDPNPETIRVCGYCFRDIRLAKNSDIIVAYHGFQRQNNYGVGMMTHSSCSGSMRPNLKDSPQVTLEKVSYLISYMRTYNKQSIVDKINAYKESEATYKEKRLQYKKGDDLKHYQDEVKQARTAVVMTINGYEAVLSDLDTSELMLNQYHPTTVADAFASLDKTERGVLDTELNELRDEFYKI